MKKLNKYKIWKGYKNAEDILPSAGDGISMLGLDDIGFYIQGVSWTHGKQPMKITPHHEFEPIDCNKFKAISFDVRIHWECDTHKIPNPNRIVIIYDKSGENNYEIPSKFVDWSKVQRWKPTFKFAKED